MKKVIKTLIVLFFPNISGKENKKIPNPNPTKYVDMNWSISRSPVQAKSILTYQLLRYSDFDLSSVYSKSSLAKNAGVYSFI